MQTEIVSNDSARWRAQQTPQGSSRLWLRDRRLGLILALALLAGTLAYQAPPALYLAIGWLGDQLFLTPSEGQAQADSEAGRWYGDELSDRADGSYTGRSRWTRQDALVTLLGLGPGQPLVLTLRVQGWPADAIQPVVDGQPVAQPLVDVVVNGTLVGQFQPTPAWQERRFLLPATAGPDGDLTIRLHSSATFASTQRYANDLRPKGIRVESLRVTAAGPTGLGLPAPGPLGWLLLCGGLGYLAFGLWLRRTPAFVITTLLVGLLAAGLALLRPWTVVLLPGAALALTLLALLALRRPIARLAGRLVYAYSASRALDSGLLVALLAWLLYLAARLAYQLPNPQHWLQPEQIPDLLLFGMLGLGLPLLVLLHGRAGLPRLSHALVASLATRRGALVGLALFLALWLGYQTTVIARLPYVGHADYADNAVVARNLVAGRGWVVDYVTQFYRLYDGVTHPQETWPLLQPVWIAPFFALLGPSNWAAKLPNLLAIALLALLIYAAGSRLWDRRVALTAVVLVLTSHLFFKLVIYTSSDLAFTVFVFAALLLVYRLGQRHSAGLPSVVGAGLLTGLMLLQKPASGGLIALGMGLWLLVGAWRRASSAPLGAALLRQLLPLALWATLALAVLTPYLLRNQLVFGRPFFSTESYDAWVLEYTSDWEQIYSVYTAQGGLRPSDDLPNQSWLLRWGFDRSLTKAGNQLRALRDYLLPPWRGLPLGLSTLLSGPYDGPSPSDPSNRDSRLLFGAGAWLAVLGLGLALRRHPRLITLLLAAFGPYSMFLVTYWHANEERYFVLLLPWLALLAGAALWQLYDRIAAAADGRWATGGLALVLVALLLAIRPSWPLIAEKVEQEPWLNASDLDAYAWLRQHAPPDAVVMTRVPWQLNWHTELPALMIPNTGDQRVFTAIARHYGVRYLVSDVAARPGRPAQQLIEQMRQDPTLLCQLYQSPSYDAQAGRRLGPTYVYGVGATCNQAESQP